MDKYKEERRYIMICYWDNLPSKIGLIHLAATDEGLVYCGSPRERGMDMYAWISRYLSEYTVEEGSNAILNEAKSQLSAYLAGESKVLDVPLHIIGTEFRKKVWEALGTIPFGETRTYGQIATQIGNPKASRAVGQANNKNPISYFVP